jgi:hypothetical protein
MSKWRKPDDVPLTGADCFLRAFEYETRHHHGASHLSQLVLRLGPGFDVDAFRSLIGEVARATPIVRAPIGRPFGIRLPAYRLGRAAWTSLPPVEVDDAPVPRADGVEVPPLFHARLNGRVAIERGELLRFDVVRYAGGAQGSDLAMTWAHLLLDGTGSELFLRRLDDCFHGRRPVHDFHRDGDAQPPSGRKQPPSGRKQPPSGRKQPPSGRKGTAAPPRALAERGRCARQWQARMIAFGAAPPRSLAGPLGRRPQGLAYDLDTLSSVETAAVTRRAAALAGFLTPTLFYLAAVMRAHDAVFTRRGADPGTYLVPLPVNLRPKGRAGAVFRTNVSLLWFHVERRHVADLAGLVTELAHQRRAAIADGLIESGAVAMELARWVPSAMQTWLARRNLRGEVASFYFAFTNEFLPGLRSFCGAEILNGFHAPSVMPSPGSSVVLSIREGRLNATHIYQRDAVNPDERLCLREQLLADLLGYERRADTERRRSWV